MRAVLVKKPGDASQLVIGEFETPSPSETQVLVKVKCFALNRMDTIQREGKYPVVPHASPLLGVEISGIIEKVGSKVTKFKEGEEVFGLMPGGGYAEYAVIEETLTMHKPESLSFEEAAGIPEVWFTAYQALFFVGKLEKGKNVLIHAGASGVGLAAIQLAKDHGSKNVYVTVGSDEKAKFCESVGATKAINYKTENWADVILKETDNKGVDIVIDFIGKDYWEKNMQVLGIDSCLVILAYMSGSIIDKVDVSTILYKRIRIEGSALRSRSLEYQSRLRDAVYENAVTHLAKHDGSLKVYIDKVFNWEDIQEAHRLLESNQTKGKIVVKVTENQ